MKALNITVRGRVQGVFFRASTKEKAIELGVMGWCSNQADGSVFIHAEGSEGALTAFETWCGKGPMMASVIDVETVDAEIGGFSTFEIRH